MIATGPTDGLPSFVEVAAALLLTVPQVAAVIRLVMWTWTLAPREIDAASPTEAQDAADGVRSCWPHRAQLGQRSLGRVLPPTPWAVRAGRG